MPPSGAPRLRILSVGGNAVSAFLSWRLQATNACDVTLVWKSGFDSVSQYGISFKSTAFGNERFKPRHVVRTPEDASTVKDGAFDYVLLCVKALPDVYDLAAVIESVVTPQHTCILVNTTHTLGVEAHLEQRFPTNVVLSLVSGAELTQLGASEFEHKASTEVWVGPANKNTAIPTSIQQDMAEALAMTLTTGQVDCHVSENIRQQQYERMIGPIAFHPASVLFDTPSHGVLLEKTGVRNMVGEVIDELLSIAHAQACSFPVDFKQRTIAEMLKPTESNSIMFQDFSARRPMEVETYLGSPIKLAQSVGVRVPRIETLYALLHNLNIINQQKPKDMPAQPMNGSGPPPLPRISTANPQQRPVLNGMNSMNGMNGGAPGRARGRVPSMGGPQQGMPGMRRPPMNGPPNGYPRPTTNGYGRPPPNMNQQQSRRGSFDNDLGEEFSHVVLYDEIPEGMEHYGDGLDLALRERELMIRQREIALREQEMRMRRGPPGPQRRGPPTPSIRNGGGGFGIDDDDDEDGYFDPMSLPAGPPIDHENFDMMSVTSKRHRKAPANNGQIRRNPESDMPQGRGGRGGYGRPSFNRNRTSANVIASLPGDHTSILDDPLLAYSDNRYGTVDRSTLSHDQSRTNSLTTERLQSLQMGGPMNGGPFPRRTSQSPGNPYSPQVGRGNGRPSPPNGYRASQGGRPSPLDGMKQPVPRYPPGQGNSVAPQQVEQHAGVSALRPPKAPINVRSLTGSASASAGSGESATIDSENSAHSSQSSLGPRPAIGVR